MQKSMSSNLASLSFKNVSFSFGNNRAIRDFSLEVQKGSFATLLGPSGCGKTTLLRLVSGFLAPDSGQILIDGEDQSLVPAEKRNVGMVFQDYALFPHLSVQDNLLYGLGIKFKNSKKENLAKIHKTARILGIANLLERFPHELSGGQQQRVALGRAIVLEPKLLLMDEPLSSLDTKLRSQVREELKEIQSQFKITTLYVTHDQEEALSLSDSIAVINHGKLQQAGTPRQIYYEPANEFVADAVGRANILVIDGKKTAVRPEWLFLQGAGVETDHVLKGTVLSASFLGQMTRYKIRLLDGNSTVITADLPTQETEPYPGEKVTLGIRRSAVLES